MREERPDTKRLPKLAVYARKRPPHPADLLESALRARVFWPVDFHVEYLQVDNFNDAAYEKGAVETYEEVRETVIVTGIA